MDNPLSLLMEAVEEGDLQMVEKLVRTNGLSFFYGGNGCYIQPAVRRRQTQMVNLLLDLGFNPNSIDRDGKTPLFVISDCPSVLESREIATLLFYYGANLNIQYGGKTALHNAAFQGNEGFVQACVQCGLDINIPAIDKSTPLHWACMNSCNSVVAVLCVNKANVNAYRCDQWSPMHMVAFWVHGEAVRTIQTLLKFGANINATGFRNENVLHCTHPYKNEVAQFLLNNEFDINLETCRGETALEIIIERARRFGDDCDMKQMSDILDGKDFDGYINDDFDPDNYPTVVTLKKHCIKLHTASFYVSYKNLRLLEGSNDVYKERCRKEVNRLKNAMLDRETTFYDILVSGKSLVYVKNKLLMESLKLHDLDEFPIYKSLITKNLRQNELRLQFLESGRDSLHYILNSSSTFTCVRNGKKCFRCSNQVGRCPFPDDVAEQIVLYLNNDSLNKVILCAEDLKQQARVQKVPSLQAQLLAMQLTLSKKAFKEGLVRGEHCAFSKTNALPST